MDYYEVDTSFTSAQDGETIIAFATAIEAITHNLELFDVDYAQLETLKEQPSKDGLVNVMLHDDEMWLIQTALINGNLEQTFFNKDRSDELPEDMRDNYQYLLKQ